MKKNNNNNNNNNSRKQHSKQTNIQGKLWIVTQKLIFAKPVFLTSGKT